MTLDELTRLQTEHNRHLARLASVVTTYREKEGAVLHHFCIRHAAEYLQWLQRIGTTGQPCELCEAELAARGEK